MTHPRKPIHAIVIDVRQEYLLDNGKPCLTKCCWNMAYGHNFEEGRTLFGPTSEILKELRRLEEFTREIAVTDSSGQVRRYAKVADLEAVLFNTGHGAGV